MASKQTEELNTLYRGWVAALKANPEMPLDELRHMFEKWDSITGEPGGVEELRTGPGAALRAWRRLRARLDVHAPQDLRPCGKSDRLPCAHRRLSARARERPSRPGERHGEEL